MENTAGEYERRAQLSQRKEELERWSELKYRGVFI